MIKLKPNTSTVISAVAVLVLILLPLVSFAQTGSGNSDSWFQGFLFSFVNVVFGWLVWATGNLLDYAVGQYVVGFGRNFVETGLGYSVNNLWVVVRDVFNLTFIFGLVFIGFKMILNNDSDAKRKLVYLILAALLVNFSLFITKFVIDFTNIAATQIAETFTQIEGTSQNPSNTPLGATIEYNISGAFLHTMGLSSIWDIATGDGNKIPDGKSGWAYIIGTFILLLVCSFVFAAGAFLLIIRFIVLNIYMVLSPVMFLSWVFPNFSGASSKFWSGFLNRAFFAPAYLLMLYIAHHILLGISTSKLMQTNAYTSMGGSFGTDPKAAEAAFLATFPTFILACAFMIAAIVVAQKMGAVGADNAMAIGNRMRNRAQSALKSSAKSGINFATYVPKAGARYLTNKVGEKTVRSLNNTQAGDGKWAKFTKLNFVDRAVRGRAEAFKKAQFGTGTTNDTEEEYKRKTNARANQTAAANKRKEDFDKATKAIEGQNTTTQDLIKALKELGDAVKNMSKEEKDELGYEKLKDKQIAQHLTDTDIEHLEKTGNYSAQQIKDIKDARKQAHTNIATYGHVEGQNRPQTGAHASAAVIDSQQKSLVAGKSVRDVGKMPVDVFKVPGMYNHITPAMVEERVKNGITRQDAINIRYAIQQHVNPNNPTAALPNNGGQWSKWAYSNSTHAAFIFT